MQLGNFGLLSGLVHDGAAAHWDTVFPNAACAVALIDRLTHHAEIVPIEGESCRKREAELTQKKRRSPA
jgi:hypothetical protein